jgi:AAA ATPase domain
MDTQPGAAFVGRDQELEELTAALRETAAGRGRLILLGGEPGIGKTRLAEELGVRARAQGHLVLVGRAWEDAGAPPFWPWVQALRAYMRAANATDIVSHLGAGAVDVAQMLPEVREHVPGLPRHETDSESARFRLFDSTATFLRNAARDRPLVVILDDLHAADTPSLLFLRFLAGQVADMRVLLLGTFRDVELTPDHPLTGAVAEVARQQATRVVHVEGLGRRAIGRVIGAATGTAPDERLTTAVARATKGNPLFIGEVMRLLTAEGRLHAADDPGELRVTLPAGVRAVIARRIGYLDAAAVGILRLASAVGPEFAVDAVCRIADLAPARVVDAVEHAVRAGLLVPLTSAPARYRFSHGLVREALYEDLTPAQRVRLHQRIAGALEAMYAADVGDHLAELAFHFGQAATRGERAPAGEGDAAVGAPLAGKAADYAGLAADHAARALAYEEAARLYRMAIAAMRGSSADDKVRTRTQLALGDVLTRGGDLDGARVAFLEASDIARQQGSGADLARAALGFGGRLLWARPGRDTRLIPLLQDALVLLGGQDEALRARLLTRLACAWRSTPERRSESETLSRQAIEIARHLEDDATLVYTLTGRFWATWWPENPQERQAIAEEVLTVAHRVHDGERIADAHFMSFLTLTELGSMSEARAEMQALVAVIDGLRQASHIWLAPVFRTELALLEGDYALAATSATQALEPNYWVTSGRDEVSGPRMHHYLLRRERGGVAEAEAVIRESVDDFPWYPLFRAAYVCLLIELGRQDEARIDFHDLGRDSFAALYRDNMWLFGMCFAATACADLQDEHAAPILYDLLAPFAGRHAIAHPEGSLGAVDRYLGLLAGTVDHLDDAERHLVAAIELNDHMLARPWAAHSRHDLAALLRRRDAPGDQVQAEALDRQALATARALGMILADRIAPSAGLPETRPVERVSGNDRATFRLQGEYWTIEFDADEFRIRDAKGMRHLARLLSHPGREMHALDLVRDPGMPTGAGGAANSDLSLDADAGTGPALDPEAKAAYRTRLAELEVELAEAEDWNDPERASRVTAERQALVGELAAAVGLGGRDRPTASLSERARVSVTRAIRSSMARIADQSVPLGAHLEATVRTGTYCVYTPDPRTPIAWDL